VIRSLRRVARNLVLNALGVVLRLTQKRNQPIVVYYAWRDFERKARALADVLARLGFNVEVRFGNSLWARARVKNSRALHVGFWNGFYLDFLPARYVFYNAEPLALKRWREDLEWTDAMRHAQCVWGYAESNAAFVTPLGTPFRYVPLGYAEYYEGVYQASMEDYSPTEDVDVLFVGHLTDRRKVLISKIEAAGVRVHAVTFENPLSGVPLDQMYARSKIILSVFRDDDEEAQVVDFARIDVLLANSRFVIQERPAERSRDLEFEQNVTTYAFDEIAERCAYFVAAESDRRELARRAHDWFKAKRAWADVIPRDDLRHLADGYTIP
jgi:hypothetical protein